MLVKNVAAEFNGRVRVAIEEYGNSAMARRFGVRRYPVVFVDDVLLARPKDFGFGGPEDVSGGLYVPWRDPANQRRFKDDLRRAVTRRLKGEAVDGLNVADVATPDDALDGPARVPRMTLEAIDGRSINLSSDGGSRVVVVELWATWCPPCRSTLEWLNTLQQAQKDRAAIVAIAVDSKREDVSRIASEVKPSYHVVLGTEAILKAFGAVAAVPKLLVFDPQGRLRRVVHGAPPDLHERIERAVADASR